MRFSYYKTINMSFVSVHFKLGRPTRIVERRWPNNKRFYVLQQRVDNILTCLFVKPIKRWYDVKAWCQISSEDGRYETRCFDSVESAEKFVQEKTVEANERHEAEAFGEDRYVKTL